MTSFLSSAASGIGSALGAAGKAVGGAATNLGTGFLSGAGQQAGLSGLLGIGDIAGEGAKVKSMGGVVSQTGPGIWADVGKTIGKMAVQGSSLNQIGTQPPYREENKLPPSQVKSAWDLMEELSRSGGSQMRSAPRSRGSWGR